MMQELVYVIGSKEFGSPFKIGKSKKSSLKNRIKTLQTGNPLTLKSFYEYTPKKGDAYNLESKIRNALINNYDYTKLKGEWIDSKHKNPVEKIGDDIADILKQEDYDYENDPVYKQLITSNKNLNTKLDEKYFDLYKQFTAIFEQLNIYEEMHSTIKKLHNKQEEIMQKASKYKKINYSDSVSSHSLHQLLATDMSYYWVDIKVNAMRWFLLIYKMMTQPASPYIHHRQGINTLRLPEDGILYVTFNNERYKYDVKKNYLSWGMPVQRDLPARFKNGVIGKHYIDKADIDRSYDWDNQAFHDHINLKVDKDFENTNLRTLKINYNNKTYNFINKDFLKEGQVAN